MSTAEPRIGAVEGVKPPGARELTPRAILCGLVVAAMCLGISIIVAAAIH